METPLHLALAITNLHQHAPLRLTPNHALLVLTLGILLIYVELNRPGRVIPGAIGLLLTLLPIPSLLDSSYPPALLLLLATSIALIALGLRRTVHPIVFAAATLGLILAFSALKGVHWAIAASCGLILGAGTSILTRIARRARLNKGLDLQRARTSRPGAFKS